MSLEYNPVSRFRATFDRLLFYFMEVESLLLSDKTNFLKRNHIRGVIRNFLDEPVEFESIPDVVTTEDDPYETAAMALFLILEDIDTADDTYRDGNPDFWIKFCESIHHGNACHINGTPQKIVIENNYFCKVTRI